MAELNFRALLFALITALLVMSLIKLVSLNGENRQLKQAISTFEMY